MKKLIYTVIALSFAVTANTAHSAAACGANTGVDRNAKTTYKVSDLVKTKGTRATVKRTSTTK
jgi:hypothetical protein